MESEQTNECSRIIVLKGGQDTGKTTVLRRVISKLFGFEVTSKESDWENRGRGARKPVDVRIYCEPKDGKGFIFVGTAGDNDLTMNGNINYMRRVRPWNVAVVGSRDDEEPLTVIREYAKDESIELEEITRKENESNEELANRIYKMIETIVKNSKTM